MISEKEGESRFYDNLIFAIVCHWVGGGSLRRAEEVVHILFARVLLLSAPDCLNTVGSLYFRKIFEVWGEGKYLTNQL